MGTQNIDTFDPESLVEPDVEFPGVGPGFRLNTDTISEESGVYAQVLLGVTERTDISLGGRFTEYESVSRDLGRVTTTADLNEDEFTPFIGIVHAINDDLAIYGSYSTIFQPQNGNLATGARIDPLEGEQLEIGLKARVLNNIHLQAALFQLDDENRAIDDPDTVGAVIGADTATTNGLEVSFVGQPMTGLEIIGGLSHIDTDLETDPTPENNLSVWGRYHLQGSDWQKWRVGLGLRATSSFETVSGGTEISASGYEVVDAMVGYRASKDIDVTLTVNNVLDEEYVSRINSTSRGVFYGDPISAYLNVKVEFN